MANKKKLQAETVEPAVEVVSIVVPEPVVETEPLLNVKSRGRFIDGNLAVYFRKYGYSVNWPDGTVRSIPAWLYKKCLDSGGRFDLE